jgi:hypothetical protein
MRCGRANSTFDGRKEMQVRYWWESLQEDIDLGEKIILVLNTV